MRGVNTVILLGTLGRDVDFKTFSNGGSVANFSIATSDTWIDKNTGERKEQTEWHRITCNNRLAEIANQYLKKGNKVYIKGSLRTRKWQDQSGQDQYTTEVRCEDMQFISSNSENNNNQGGYNNQGRNNNQGGYNNQGRNNNQGDYNINQGYQQNTTLHGRNNDNEPPF